MAEKPIPKSSEADKELTRLENQFDKFNEQVNQLTLDRMNEAPKKEHEPQTKIAQSDIADSKDIYLKPFRTIMSKEKFNENFRSDYQFAKEYVFIIAENYEIKGELIEMWTKPFPGIPAEFWKIPVNKPLWTPRYVAEQLKRCSYHRLSMDEKRISGQNQFGSEYGQFVVDETINRIDARPASKKKSIFMGSNIF